MSKVIRDFQGEGDVATEVLRVLFTYYALRESSGGLSYNVNSGWVVVCLQECAIQTKFEFVKKPSRIGTSAPCKLSMTQQLQTQA